MANHLESRAADGEFQGPVVPKLLPDLPRHCGVPPISQHGKLSITEHDDPRTAYVNTDKAMFQTRYAQIVAVETAIKARIP